MTERLVKITLEDLLKKLSVEKLELITNKAFCGRYDCRTTTILVGFEDDIYLNELGDTILHGKCKYCGKTVNRYIETGEFAFGRG